MTESIPLTVAEFLQSHEDYPDSGRWSELNDGMPVHLMAPDEVHGLSVMNLTKALAEYNSGHAQSAGYACFELGLIVGTGPDCVHRPAISYFSTGPLFSNSDKLVTDEPPQLIIEMASTPDRRRGMRQRIDRYHAFGATSVWVVDPEDREVIVVPAAAESNRFATTESISDEHGLPGFSMAVDAVFQQPEWWLG